MTTRILILAANPTDSSRLRLDEEVREIENGLDRAKERDRFLVEAKWAVRPRDVQRAMLDFTPNILHFSGHGSGAEGIVFEDNAGHSRLVKTNALAGLFKLFAPDIQCVVLNACYSEIQARAIAQHIPYVIGMNKAIGDKAAIAFAVAFYDAIGSGRDIEFAYKLGCNAIEMEGIPEHLTPVLISEGQIPDTVGSSVTEQVVNLYGVDVAQPLDDHVAETLKNGLSARGYRVQVHMGRHRSLDIEDDDDPVSETVAHILLLSPHAINHVDFQNNLARFQASDTLCIPVTIRLPDEVPDAVGAWLQVNQPLPWQGVGDDARLVDDVLTRLVNPAIADQKRHDNAAEPLNDQTRGVVIPAATETVTESVESVMWQSLIVEQEHGAVVGEWLEEESTTVRKVEADQLLPFTGSDAQLALMHDLLPQEHEHNWSGKIVRLRVMTDDEQLALLPWHCLQPQGVAACLVESGMVLRRYQAGFSPTTVSTPLLIIPSDASHKIISDKHYALVQEYFASYIGIRGPVPRVVNPAQVERELRLHQPDVIYIYARFSDNRLQLDRDAAGNASLSFDELAEWIDKNTLRPVVIISLVGQSLDVYPAALMKCCRFLWIQQARRQSRLDDLESGLANVLEGLAQTEDVSQLILREAQNAQSDACHYLWLNGRSPKVLLNGDDTQRQLRAALLKVMLGRSALKDRMYSGLYRSEYLNSPTFLTYVVSGYEVACPFDVPAQIQQRLQWDDPERALPVIPFYFHLNMEVGSDAFDAFEVIDTALSQGLLHGSSDIDVIFQQELDRRGLMNQECCIMLNWQMTVPMSQVGALEQWLNAWMEILCSDFAQTIPEKCILVSGLCLQTEHGADVQALQDGANQQLSRNQHCALRLVRIREALGKLEPEEISDFLQYNQRWRAALQLDEYGIDPYDYAHWVYAHSQGGEFDSTIRTIWQQHQQEYQEYLGTLA